MLTIRRFVQVSVFNARQQNQRKCFASVSQENGAKQDDKRYPLEGIRILDLTRIGNETNFAI